MARKTSRRSKRSKSRSRSSRRSSKSTRRRSKPRCYWQGKRIDCEAFKSFPVASTVNYHHRVGVEKRLAEAAALARLARGLRPYVQRQKERSRSRKELDRIISAAEKKRDLIRLKKKRD